MGRRSRKRIQSESGAEKAPDRLSTTRKGSVELKPELPPAPWGSFPLAEIAVLLALIIGVIGFIVGSREGMILVFIALGLGSLAGLEVSLREHLTGFRSHSSLLAGLPTAISLAVSYASGLPFVAMIAIAVAIFSAGFWLFRDLFKRRSGGKSFR